MLLSFVDMEATIQITRSLSLNSLLSRSSGAGPKLSNEDGLD